MQAINDFFGFIAGIIVLILGMLWILCIIIVGVLVIFAPIILLAIIAWGVTH